MRSPQRRRIGLLMRVEIPVSLLQDSDGNENAELVVKLISFFREARHDWAISPLDVEAVDTFCRLNVPNFAQAYGLLAQKASAAHVWRPRGSSAGVVTVAADTLAEDVRDLERAAVLVVENATYDWQMIKGLALVLGCEDIVRAEQASRLIVYNGGGMAGAAWHAVDQADRFTRTKRVVLVIDSDSFQPGERTKNHAHGEKVVERGGSSHVLKFREMENYIPNRVLAYQPKGAKGYSDMAKRLKSLKCLSHEQRAHFDMKKGFKGKPVQGSAASTYHVPPEHGGLYNGVGVGDLVVLQEGFGTSLPQLFLKSVERGGIAERDLDGLGLGATQELRLMLGKIRSVI
ncbi:hypothetical protein ACH4XT_06715 [Streptomyces avidinii]|uniref:hypothetical protein n=1 Tax=Streptomyces avidinii TaxID=1895 RepID=UPI0037B446B9